MNIDIDISMGTGIDIDMGIDMGINMGMGVANLWSSQWCVKKMVFST